MYCSCKSTVRTVDEVHRAAFHLRRADLRNQIELTTEGCGQQKKHEAHYGDTWGKEFQSQVNRTTAAANPMRVNALKRMDAYTDLLDGVVDTITGVQETKGMKSLFSLGEMGSGVSLGFDDYSLISFVVLQ